MPDHDKNWPASLWADTAVVADPFPVLDQVLDIETCVIGAGYTGLSTALHLSELGREVVVIDQHQPGWGCSGRNGGQINPAWKALPESIRTRYDSNTFDQTLQLINNSCDQVFELIDRYDIECDSIRPGYVMGIRGQKQLDWAMEWARQWGVLGSAVEFLDRSESESYLGTSAYDRCMIDTRGGSLQPLSFARGLARVAVQNGADIYGDTKALSSEVKDDRWVVATREGSVRCQNIVIGTNGYTDHLFPKLKKAIVPVASLLSATTPLKSHIAKHILPNKNAVSDTAGMPVYYRLDSQNRMVFGGRGRIDGKTGRCDTRALRQQAIDLFPALQDADWQYDWGGYPAMTVHACPMLIKLGENAFSGLGYNGRGLAMAVVMGKQLAQAVIGEKTVLPQESLQTIPFHALHSLGVAARIGSGHLRDFFTRHIPD
ncbi:MAG: FAD-binding oxidoreductase [Pseudomonadota bacterium]